MLTRFGHFLYFQSLKPDPIIKLKRIVGYGGATFREVLWTKNGACVIYPCHAVIVSMEISTGHQRFFIGHTDKVCILVAWLYKLYPRFCHV